MLIRALKAHASGSPSGKVWEAEAAWRQAVDPMFIICGQQVLDAGIAHLKDTERRILAALRGTDMDGQGMTRKLSKEMRRDLGA
ncbi:hypothetical protein AB0K48_45045 [Nonomuraea sp. NPDC055795]